MAQLKDTKIWGGLILSVTIVTDTYTILSSDYTVVGNKATAFTITLPTAVVGQIFNVPNIGVGTITLDGAGTDTINGSLTKYISTGDTITIQCYEANKWVVI